MLRLLGSELCKIIAPSALIFIALFIFSLQIESPTPNNRILDVNDALNSLEGSSPAYVMFKSPLLAVDEPAVILIGPSNVQLGFRPAEIAPLLPGITPHNLSFGGANIDGMAAAVDLVYGQRPIGRRDDLIFVFGLWYGEFLHNESNPAITPLGRQMQRFGIFQYQDDRFVLQVRPESFDLIAWLLRPIFAVQKLVGSSSPLARKLSNNRSDTTTAPSPLPTLSNVDIPDAQLAALVAISKRIKREGGALVLADLPMPSRHTESEPLWSRYQSIKRAILQTCIEWGAVYLDMQDLNDNTDFSDYTHPLPAATVKWAARLAAGLKQAGLVPQR